MDEATLLHLARLGLTPQQFNCKSKHPAIVARNDRGLLVYLKFYNVLEEARTEVSNLEIVAAHTRGGVLGFHVPERMGEILETQKYFILPLEYVQGENGLDLLNSNRWQGAVLDRVIEATATIHDLLSETYGNTNPKTGSDCGAVCEARLAAVLEAEMYSRIPRRARSAIEEFNTTLVRALDVSWRGSSLDYYKDSNPANWALDPRANAIWALDFEGLRGAPFPLDLINVCEFPVVDSPNISLNQAVCDYAAVRSRLNPQWRGPSGDAIPVALALCGLYRHQEQIAHRFRDIDRRIDVPWQKLALNYHLGRFKSHALALQSRGLSCFALPAIECYEELVREG